MKRQQLSSDVWVFTSALYQTNTIVVRSARMILLFDPNWLPEEIEEIRTLVASVQEQRKLVLIFTHSDYDHIVGYGAFQPSHVIASAAFATNPKKDEDIRQVTAFDQSHYIQRAYPITYPIADLIIHRDGQIMQFEELRLTFYLSRGHTPEGLFTIIEPYGIWVAGDYLSDIEFPLVKDIGEYQNTLSKVDPILNDHEIQWMIPGHGSPAGNVSEILRRRDESLEYLLDIEKHVRDRVVFPEEKYRDRYAFWDGIGDWHRENVRSLK